MNHLESLIGKINRFHHGGTPLPKAAKPAWAYQLTRLPSLMVYVKVQFVYTTSNSLAPPQSLIRLLKLSWVLFLALSLTMSMQAD